MNIICKIKGHDWKYSYNHGVPPHSGLSIDEILEGFETGKYFEVFQCRRCGVYSHESDHLNPLVKFGAQE